MAEIKKVLRISVVTFKIYISLLGMLIDSKLEKTKTIKKKKKKYRNIYCVLQLSYYKILLIYLQI